MTEFSTNPHLYALIAGELSGDTLGAGLMKAILRHDPEAKFIGIGGPKMCKNGLTSAFKMEELSVMGIFEVIKHLRPILKIRSEITKQLLAARPCVMIGIDSPDFNLTVESKLKAAGIKTIHYVSPSVWAWREGRMKKIRAACDEVLALLPFEKDYYDEVGMPCTYVGHALANTIPLEVNQKAARERIALAKNCVDGLSSKVLAVLPGSRRGIISRMLPIYARTARILKDQMPDLTFIAVAPNRDKALLMKDLWLQYVPELSITIFVGNSQDVIASADVCLVTSGTVAFETMLLKRPMVVAYKVSALSAAISRRLLKINMFSLPNLLAKREIVKEFIQEDCTPFNLSTECMRLLASDNLLMKQEFAAIHEQIRTNSDELAAQAVMRLAQQAIANAQAAQSAPGSQNTYSAPGTADGAALEPLTSKNFPASKVVKVTSDTLTSTQAENQSLEAGAGADGGASAGAKIGTGIGTGDGAGKTESAVSAATQVESIMVIQGKTGEPSAITLSGELISRGAEDSAEGIGDNPLAQGANATTSSDKKKGKSKSAKGAKDAKKGAKAKAINFEDKKGKLVVEQVYKVELDSQGYRSFVDQKQKVDIKPDISVDYSKTKTDVQDMAQGRTKS